MRLWPNSTSVVTNDGESHPAGFEKKRPVNTFGHGATRSQPLVSSLSRCVPAFVSKKQQT